MLSCCIPLPTYGFIFRNLLTDDKSKEDEDEKVGTPEGKAEVTTPTGKRKDKGKSSDDKKDKRKTSAGKGKAVPRRGSQVLTTPPPGGSQTPSSEVDGLRYFSSPIGDISVQALTKYPMMQCFFSASGDALLEGRAPKYVKCLAVWRDFVQQTHCVSFVSDMKLHIDIWL